MREFESKGQTRLSDYFLPLEYLESKHQQEVHYGNLRRAIKAEAMQFGFKTQIVWPKTLTGGPGVQEDAIRAWNFLVALYYKAGGYPWHLADADPSTCNIGISFFHSRHEEDRGIRTSMAQIFPHAAGGLVLKGDKVALDKRSKQPRLSQQSADRLVREALRLYESQMHQRPRRVVIHKTSRFSGEEQAGFHRGLEGVEYRDFVALERLGTGFYRMGKYPPLRGTAIEMSSATVLFTRGYVPFLKTYPGPGVPRPLTILEHFGDSPMSTIVEDIMGLTKMNWNSSDFAMFNPVTIAFSRRVGDVLSELSPEAAQKTDYSYYM